MNKFLLLLALSVFEACNTSTTTSAEKTVDSLKQVAVDSLKLKSTKTIDSTGTVNAKAILSDTLKKNK